MEKRAITSTWRVTVKMPYIADPIIVENVPGNSEYEAGRNAKKYLKSLERFDDYVVDGFDCEAVECYTYTDPEATDE